MVVRSGRVHEHHVRAGARAIIGQLAPGSREVIFHLHLHFRDVEVMVRYGSKRTELSQLGLQCSDLCLQLLRGQGADALRVAAVLIAELAVPGVALADSIQLTLTSFTLPGFVSAGFERVQVFFSRERLVEVKAVPEEGALLRLREDLALIEVRTGFSDPVCCLAAVRVTGSSDPVCCCFLAAVRVHGAGVLLIWAVRTAGEGDQGRNGQCHSDGSHVGQSSKTF